MANADRIDARQGTWLALIVAVLTAVAVIDIADTGPGISSGALGRIFDPFFTTKPVGEGTGLGLSISYEIVTKHRGEIRAESPATGGAVFTLRLPVVRAGAPGPVTRTG